MNAMKYNCSQKSVPGYKFLQAICEKPEFVCTCCHKWMFRRSVIKYDETQYNMSNDTVKETLHERYHHPMQVTLIQGVCSAHEHPIDYDYDNSSESQSEEENSDDVNIPSTSTGNTVPQQNNVITHNSYEYISNTCHNSLK